MLMCQYANVPMRQCANRRDVELLNFLNMNNLIIEALNC